MGLGTAVPRTLAGLAALLAAEFAEADAAAATDRWANRLRASATTRSEAYSFSYTNHGMDWHEGQCGSREKQSPIDLGGTAPWEAAPSATAYFDYARLQGSFALQNDGHALSADLALQGYGGIVYKDERFSVTSVNFHAHSEHAFRGKTLPVEVHVVHKSESRDHALIVAIPFDLYVEPPQAYTSLGFGVCPGSYYEGWDVGDARNLSACQAKCAAEPECQFINFKAGSTCSRFTAAAAPCVVRPMLGYEAFEKATTANQWLLLGQGHCSAAPYASAAAVSLQECQSRCSAQSACLFVAFSENRQCLEYDGAAEDCAPRPEGALDHKTYQKRSPGESLSLAALLGTGPLPKTGERRSHVVGAPSQALDGLLSGRAFFAYEGSLTAPPCTESVTWLVGREPAALSEAQLQRLRDSILEATADLGNYRALMPLMGRRIDVVAAVLGRPPDPAPLPPDPALQPVPVGLAAGTLAAEALGHATAAARVAEQIRAAVVNNHPSGALPAAAMGPAAPAPAPPGLAALALRRRPRAAAAVEAGDSELAGLVGAAQAAAARSLWFAREGARLETATLSSS